MQRILTGSIFDPLGLGRDDPAGNRDPAPAHQPKPQARRDRPRENKRTA